MSIEEYRIISSPYSKGTRIALNVSPETWTHSAPIDYESWLENTLTTLQIQGDLIGGTNFESFSQKLSAVNAVGGVRWSLVEKDEEERMSFDEYVLSLEPFAYWPFDDESGGVTDVSGNNYHGTIVGGGADSPTYRGPVLREGSKGSMGFGIDALSVKNALFNGEDYPEIKYFMDQGNDGTMIGYFMRTANTDFNIVANYWRTPSSGDSRYRIYGNPVHFERPDNTNKVRTLTPSSNEIIFFAWKKDIEKRQYKTFMNGQWYSIASFKDNLLSGNTGLYIPGAYSWNYYPMRGYVSDFAMFDKALSDEEIEKIYELGQLGGGGDVSKSPEILSITNNSQTAGGPKTIEIPSCDVGDLLLIFVTTEVNDWVAGPIINNMDNGFTRLVNGTSADSYSQRYHGEVWYKITDGTENINVEFSQTNNSLSNTTTIVRIKKNTYNFNNVSQNFRIAADAVGAVGFKTPEVVLDYNESTNLFISFMCTPKTYPITSYPLPDNNTTYEGTTGTFRNTICTLTVDDTLLEESSFGTSGGYYYMSICVGI